MTGAERIVANRTFPTLNAVRAAGALMVVLTHVAFNTGRINHGWTGAVLSRLDFGVALFFVVSGFLLARPSFVAAHRGTARPGTPHYFWKRALRILPLYWVVVVVAMLADSANRHASVGDWVSQLTLTQLYRPVPLAGSLTQMWSLCTEVAFYLMLPVLIGWLARRAGAGLDIRRVLVSCGALTVLGLAWAAFNHHLLSEQWHAAQWLPAYLPWFMAGVALAACSVHPAAAARLDRMAEDLTGWWLLGGGLFAIACSDIAGPRRLVPPTAWEGFAKCTLYGAAAVCLVLPLVFGPPLAGPVRRWMAGTVPVWLGDISFGVFCIHMVVLVVGMRVLGIEVFTGHFWSVLAMTLIVSVAAAAASYRWLEKPFLRLKNVGHFARTDPALSDSASGDPATSAMATSAHH